MVFLVVLAVFVAFTLAILWRPSSIIALAFCVYPFEQWAQANSSYFQQHSTIMNYGVGALALLALAVVMLRGQNPLNPMTGATWCWLALYLYAAFSCVWAPDPKTSIFLYKFHLPYMVTFAGIMPLMVQDSRDVRDALKLTLFMGTFVMLLLLFGTRVHEYGRTIVMKEGMGVVNRAGEHATRLTPLIVASMAAHILLIGVLMNFVGIGRIWQALRWVVGFIALALIFRSQSRGQLIAGLIAMAVFIPYSRRSKKLTGLVAAVVTVALVATIMILAYKGFVESDKRWSIETMSRQLESTRLEYSLKLLSYWFAEGPMYWLFGVGSSASFHPAINEIYCHVVLVEILCELGVFGLCIYLAFLAFIVRDSRRLLRVSQYSVVDRGVAATIVAIFLFQFILTFKEGSFLTHTFTLGWGLILTRTAALTLTECRRERLRSAQRWYMRYWASGLSGVSPEAVRSPG